MFSFRRQRTRKNMDMMSLETFLNMNVNKFKDRCDAFVLFFLISALFLLNLHADRN
jgi:uncharacterized membrane protein YesL